MGDLTMAVRVRWFILPPPPPVNEARTTVVKFGVHKKGVKRMTIAAYRRAMQRERAESRKGYGEE